MSGKVERSFLEQIVALPDDDTPRLVFADWLEEQGRDDRAEFVRVQVDRARLPAWDPAQVRLRVREKQLLDAHGEEWLKELPAVEGARWEGFRRGVVAEVSFTSYEALRKSAHACRQIAPVEAVTVRWPRKRETKKDSPPIAELRELTLTGRPDDDEQVERLAGSPQLATLRTLAARGLYSGTLGILTGSPHMAALKALRLPGNDLGNEGILALIGAATLAAVEEIDLTGRGVSERYNEDPRVSRPGMEALAAWPGLASVRTLNLSGNDLAVAGLRALLRSPHATGLKELSLRATRIDGQAMAEFDAAKPKFRLDVLDLGENVLKDLGAEYAAIVPCLKDLKVLRLDRCEVSSAGAKLFARKAKFLPGLRELDIGHNHFGPAGLGTLLDRAPAALHTLRMRDNDLGDEGAERLAGSPASAPLHEVDLSQNRMGAAGVRTLSDSAHLRGLLVLNLSDNPIDPKAVAALRASPVGRRLGVLEHEAAPAPPPADEGDEYGPPFPRGFFEEGEERPW